MDKSKHPNLYKKRPIESVRNRVTSEPNSAEKQRVNTLVVKFFELFKNKHM